MYSKTNVYQGVSNCFLCEQIYNCGCWLFVPLWFTHTPEVLCMATTQQLISYKSTVLFFFFSALWLKHLCTLKYQNEAWSYWRMAWQNYITNYVGNPLIPLFISGVVLLIIFLCVEQTGAIVLTRLGPKSWKSDKTPCKIHKYILNAFMIWKPLGPMLNLAFGSMLVLCII